MRRRVCWGDRSPKVPPGRDIHLIPLIQCYEDRDVKLFVDAMHALGLARYNIESRYWEIGW